MVWCWDGGGGGFEGRGERAHPNPLRGRAGPLPSPLSPLPVLKNRTLPDPVSILITPRPSPMLPCISRRLKRRTVTAISKSIPPLPLSIFSSAPRSSGMVTVTLPDPVSMSNKSTSIVRSRVTEPLPVSNLILAEVTFLRSMPPEPVSIFISPTSKSPPVTEPDPVSTKSDPPVIPDISTGPEPVSMDTSPSALVTSTGPEPVSIESSPRVSRVVTGADATSMRRSPSTLLTSTSPTPRKMPTVWPLGIEMVRSA